jgi:hypothetical protein
MGVTDCVTGESRDLVVDVEIERHVASSWAGIAIWIEFSCLVLLNGPRDARTNVFCSFAIPSPSGTPS